jgi:hypothetical protein
MDTVLAETKQLPGSTIYAAMHAAQAAMAAHAPAPISVNAPGSYKPPSSTPAILPPQVIISSSHSNKIWYSDYKINR